MKFLTAILAAAIYANGALSEPEAVNAEAQCGALGVVKIDTSALPDGVEPNNIRTCLDHPDGPPVDEKKLVERKCWDRGEYGCSKKGWYWKQCGPKGSGQWCWTAENGGFGPWHRCSSWRGCNKGQACGAGGCKKCGCSC